MTSFNYMKRIIDHIISPVPTIIWLVVLIYFTVSSIVIMYAVASGFMIGIKETLDTEPVYIHIAPVATSTPEVKGKASYYDYDLNGIIWSQDHNTAASRDLPRYSKVKVTNLANDKSTIVYINDYGPDVKVHPDRIIDLSSHAFNEISDTRLGIINVKIEKQ